MKAILTRSSVLLDLENKGVIKAESTMAKAASFIYDLQKMKLRISFLICLSFFSFGCDRKAESNSGVNRVTEIKIEPRNEEGKEGWKKLEIFMELNRANPVYPIGANLGSLKVEKLKLTFNRSMLSEDSYYAEFYYFPSDEEGLSEINMEDFLWSPHLGFQTIKLQNLEE